MTCIIVESPTSFLEPASPFFPFQVWRLASGGVSKQKLERDDWLVACKLVAAVQVRPHPPTQPLSAVRRIFNHYLQRCMAYILALRRACLSLFSSKSCCQLSPRRLRKLLLRRCVPTFFRSTSPSSQACSALWALRRCYPWRTSTTTSIRVS